MWRRINKTVTEAIRWDQYWDWSYSLPTEQFDNSVADRFGFQFEQYVSIQSTEKLTFSQHSRSCDNESFKLKLSCLATPNKITLRFHYDSGRYSHEDMNRLAESYLTLLNSSLQQPEAQASRSL